MVRTLNHPVCTKFVSLYNVTLASFYSIKFNGTCSVKPCGERRKQASHTKYQVSHCIHLIMYFFRANNAPNSQPACKNTYPPVLCIQTVSCSCIQINIKEARHLNHFHHIWSALKIRLVVGLLILVKRPPEQNSMCI